MIMNAKLYLFWIISILIMQQSLSSLDFQSCSKSPRGSITFNDTCYYYMETSQDFVGALNLCNRYNGHLPITDYEDVLTELTKFYRSIEKEYHTDVSKQIWYGATDIEKEGKFREVTKIEQNLTSEWATKNKVNTRTYDGRTNVANCAVADVHTVDLFAIKCSEKRRFFCEFISPPCHARDVHISNAEYEACQQDIELPFQTKITITCNDGYYLSGPSQIICEYKGQWSDMPRCNRGCAKPKPMANTILVTEQSMYGIGSRVIYVCDRGYVSIDNPRTTHVQSNCNENGMWDPPIKGCTVDKRYSTGKVEVVEGMSIALPCVHDLVKSELRKMDEDKEFPFFWLKNSKIMPSKSSEYDLTKNGTLILSKITEESVGTYICFVFDNPAKIGFHLMLKPQSCNISIGNTESIMAVEGSSILLLCPHDSSFNSFTWFKNDDRYYVKGDEVLLPDGSLFFKNVKNDNDGIYVCQIGKVDSFCGRNNTINLTVKMSSNSICGKNSPGHDDHPWVASIWLKDEMAPFCYGTLIHESWVITTAQCVAGYNRKRDLNLYVRFDKESNKGNSALDVSVKTVKIHPMFSKKQHINDIGLLQLQTPIFFSKTIRPICLTSTDFTEKPKCNLTPLVKGTVVGWGPLEKEDYEHRQRLTESLSLANANNDCFPTAFNQSDKIICCKKTTFARTTFAGDAGSPLEIIRDGRTYLFGIQSWGDRATLVGNYDYFTKISHYIPWVTSFPDITVLD